MPLRPPHPQMARAIRGRRRRVARAKLERRSETIGFDRRDPVIEEMKGRTPVRVCGSGPSVQEIKRNRLVVRLGGVLQERQVALILRSRVALAVQARETLVVQWQAQEEGGPLHLLIEYS